MQNTWGFSIVENGWLILECIFNKFVMYDIFLKSKFYPFSYISEASQVDSLCYIHLNLITWSLPSFTVLLYL